MAFGRIVDRQRLYFKNGFNNARLERRNPAGTRTNAATNGPMGYRWTYTYNPTEEEGGSEESVRHWHFSLYINFTEFI